MAVSIALLLWLAGITQTSAGTGAVVSGQVVDASSGRPIPGAIVTVNGSAVAGARSSPAPASLPPRVMTNAAGAFVIRGLNTGTLFLYVTRGGYVDAKLGQPVFGGCTRKPQVRDGSGLRGRRPHGARRRSPGRSRDESGEPIVGASRRSGARSSRPASPTAATPARPTIAGHTVRHTHARRHLLAVVSSGAPIPGGILASGAGSRAGTGVFIYPDDLLSSRADRQKWAAVAAVTWRRTAQHIGCSRRGRLACRARSWLRPIGGCCEAGASAPMTIPGLMRSRRW